MPSVKRLVDQIEALKLKIIPVSGLAAETRGVRQNNCNGINQSC